MVAEAKDLGQGEGKPHYPGSGAQNKDEGTDGESPGDLAAACTWG